MPKAIKSIVTRLFIILLFQVFRRWETREEDGTNRTYEVDYELKLVLLPDSPESTTETHQQKWPKVFEKHRGRLHRRMSD